MAVGGVVEDRMDSLDKFECYPEDPREQENKRFFYAGIVTQLLLTCDLSHGGNQPRNTLPGVGKTKVSELSH